MKILPPMRDTLKILIHSYVFPPSIGGIEVVSRQLAQYWSAIGCEVRVVTYTSSDGDFGLPYDVYRNPDFGTQKLLIKWCDVVWQNNPSLVLLAPVLFDPKPVVVTYQTWPYHLGRSWKAIVKRLLARRVSAVAISRAIDDSIGGGATIIPNPFEAKGDALEKGLSERSRDVIFVGRLVSDKGVGFFLRAAKRFEEIHGQELTVSVVGDGPERGALECLTNVLNLRYVKFFGNIPHDDVVQLMGDHRCLVVPSLWAEPFGIVALEGLTAGCFVIVSDSGGLPEAVGPYGIRFETGNAESLVDALDRALTQANEKDDGGSLSHPLCAMRAKYLKQFAVEVVGQRYLQIFNQAIGNGVKRC